MKIAAAALVALALLYVHVFFDPLQLGVEKSARFSWERFRRVQKGEPIDRVIAALGEPIRQPETLEVINATPDDPCFPRRCRTYRFAGKSEAGAFVLGYREAIIVVGADGRVVDIVEREE